MSGAPSRQAILLNGPIGVGKTTLAMLAEGNADRPFGDLVLDTGRAGLEAARGAGTARRAR
jgi:replication-associated recombination protein RarA